MSGIGEAVCSEALTPGEAVVLITPMSFPCEKVQRTTMQLRSPRSDRGMLSSRRKGRRSGNVSRGSPLPGGTRAMPKTQRGLQRDLWWKERHEQAAAALSIATADPDSPGAISVLPEEPEHPKTLPSASSSSFSLLGTGYLPHRTAFGRNNGNFVNHPSSQGCQPPPGAHRGLLGLLPLETYLLLQPDRATPFPSR